MMKKIILFTAALLISATMASCTADSVAEMQTSEVATGGGDGSAPIPPPPPPKP